MTTPQHRRWLNIIIDGDVDLSPYWPEIVSEHLAKIVRSFCDNSQEQGNNSAYELGLVLYNGNSDIGYCAQFIEWTSDMKYFLRCLPNLVLNGDESNRTVMTKGLVDALLMFTKATEFKEERHCVLVAMKEPMPLKTQVPVPMIKEDGLCGTDLEVRDVDYFEVARIFALLGISFSVITPTEHPIFRAMFHLGNDINEAEYNPLVDDKMGELTVMLSKNFKVARQAILHKNIADENVAECSSSRKRSAYSMAEATDHVTNPNVTTCDLPVPEDLCSAAMTTMIENAKAVTVRPEAIESTASQEPPQELVAVPNPIPLQTHDHAVFNAPTPMNVFDDIMLDLINSNDDDDHMILATKRSKPSSAPMAVFSFEDLFQPSPPPQPHEPPPNAPCHNNESTMPSSPNYTTTIEIPLEEALRAFEQEYELALMPSSKGKAPKSTNDASNGGDSSFSGAPVGSTMTRFEASSSSSSAAPQCGSDQMGNFIKFQPLSSSTQMLPGTSNHEVDCYVPFSSALSPHHYFIGASDNHAMGNYTPSNIHHHHQIEVSSSSVPNYQYGTQIASHHHYQVQWKPPVIQIQHGQFSSAAMQSKQQLHASAAAEAGYHYLQGMVATKNYYAPSSVVGAGSALVPPALVAGPVPQALVDFNLCIHTWEGSLTGSTSHGTSSYRAKAFRKSTSPLTLTIQWKNKLTIDHYISQKAVEHTKRIMKTQPDSVFFHITELNNSHLYDFLISNNMYARIDLPSQALILAPTENSLFYVGTVFPEDTLFVEPA